MKKKFNLFYIIFSVALLLFPIKTLAASGTYSISSSSSVEIGNTISVTFKISSKKLYYWQAYITYDTSKLQLISGSTNFQGDIDSSSNTKTLKFKAKKTGSAWVAISMGDADNNINENSENISYKKATKTITVKEKKVVTYSSNNYLKSLTIDNYKLTPEFNKNTFKYNVELPANTTEIKINATKEDNTASISGTGKRKVSEGVNKLVIKVTAENGNTKEYIINATVKELDPIEITLENEKFNVIRKKEQLPKVNSTYTQTTIKINNEDVPGLKSEITKYTLIGLKDNSGNINLYIYDEINNSYTIYNEVTFNKLVIIPLDEDTTIKIPKGYKKASIIVNEQTITGYKSSNSYPIFIGMNIETGEKNLYSYDEEENTIQRFINNENNKGNNLLGNITSIATNDTTTYTYIIIFLGSFLIITYTIILVNLIKNKKKTKKIELNYKK